MREDRGEGVEVGVGQVPELHGDIVARMAR